MDQLVIRNAASTQFMSTLQINHWMDRSLDTHFDKQHKYTNEDHDYSWIKITDAKWRANAITTRYQYTASFTLMDRR